MFPLFGRSHPRARLEFFDIPADHAAIQRPDFRETTLGRIEHPPLVIHEQITARAVRADDATTEDKAGAAAFVCDRRDLNGFPIVEP